YSGAGESAYDADPKTKENGLHSLRQDRPNHVVRLRSQSHLQTDLSCALLYRIGEDTIDAEGRQDQRDHGECAQRLQLKSSLRIQMVKQVLNGRDLVSGDRSVHRPDHVSYRSDKRRRIRLRAHHQLSTIPPG